MVNFKRLQDRAKDVVEKRGGKDALKDDMQELRSIAKGKGSIKEKAAAAKDALKDPGRRGPATGASEGGPAGRPAAKPAARPTTPPTATTPPAPTPPAPTPPASGASADTPENPRTK
jgi:hypothetical protein